jgi:membrane protein YqaA with SNARE-associated domain
MEPKANQADYGAAFMSILIVIGFLAVTFALVFRQVVDSQVALVLFGTLSTAFGSVVNYWLGSSSGSRAKDVTIREAMTAKPPETTP